MIKRSSLIILMVVLLASWSTRAQGLQGSGVGFGNYAPKENVPNLNRVLTDTNDVEEAEDLSEDEFIDESEVAEFGNSSLVVGLSEPMRFSLDGDFFNDQAYMLMLGSPKNNLTLHYGESTFGTGSESAIFRINGQVGGNAYLWRRFLRLPLSIYVPIHFNAGYQNVSLDISEEDYQSTYRGRESKDLLNFSLGAGAGASFKLPLSAVPLIGEQITLDAMFVRSPGLMIRILDEDTSGMPGQSNDHDFDTGWAITNDLLLQARVHQFLESSIGVTAGFKFSRIDWDDERGDFGDLINMISGDDTGEHMTGYSSVYVGINW